MCLLWSSEHPRYALMHFIWLKQVHSLGLGLPLSGRNSSDDLLSSVFFASLGMSFTAYIAYLAPLILLVLESWVEGYLYVCSLL